MWDRACHPADLPPHQRAALALPPDEVGHRGGHDQEGPRRRLQPAGKGWAGGQRHPLLLQPPPPLAVGRDLAHRGLEPFVLAPSLSWRCGGAWQGKLEVPGAQSPSGAQGTHGCALPCCRSETASRTLLTEHKLLGFGAVGSKNAHKCPRRPCLGCPQACHEPGASSQAQDGIFLSRAASSCAAPAGAAGGVRLS